MLVTGFNLFKQWAIGEDVLRSFTECSESVHEEMEILGNTWSYLIFKLSDKFLLSGLYSNQLEPTEIQLPTELSQNRKTVLFSGNDRYLLIADTTSGKIWKCLLCKEPAWYWELIQLTQLSDVEFKTDDRTSLANSEHKIVSLSVGSTMAICLTEEGNLYNIPEKICVKCCMGKVIDVQCGHEHAILLTNKGCVYTWGNGRRCQLGNGELIVSETLQQVEALDGVYIILVRAGGWHCCALSKSGDLYVWGWNDSGQLGIRETFNSPPHKKVKTDEHVLSRAIPTLVQIFERNEPLSLNCDVVDVACGSKHTVIKLKDNSIWASGNNAYGQLGVTMEQNLWYFQKVYEANSKCKMTCGPWSTVLKL